MTEQINMPKLRFGEFTSSWVSSKLGKLSAIRSASRVHREQWTDTGVPFFRSSDVVAAYKGSDNNKAFISYDLFEELSEKSGKPKKDDLLVTGGGSIGIPYLIPNDEPLYFKDADLLWFKNKKALDGYFLYEFLITSKFRRYLASITHTGTISHYTIEQAKSTPITLPELAEQQKIASFLSKVDEKITLLTEKKAKLTEYKKGVMQQLFDGAFQEQDGKLVFVPPTLRFKADDGSEFPDWEEKRFDDIFNFSSGKNIKQNEASPDFTTPCVRYGELYHLYGEVITTVVNHTNLESSELTFSEGNEILLPSAGEDPLDIGAASALTLKGVAIGRTINVLRPKTKDSYSHIHVSYYINNKLKKKISTLARGASISNVYNSDLKGLSIPLPSLKEQQVVESFLLALEKKLALANTELEKVKEWKKGLLQQMFV